MVIESMNLLTCTPAGDLDYSLLDAFQRMDLSVLCKLEKV